MKKIVKKMWTCQNKASILDGRMFGVYYLRACDRNACRICPVRKSSSCRPITITIEDGHGKGEGK